MSTVDTAPTELAPAPTWPGLTPREAQTAELLALGATNTEIAEHLQISIKTVDTHRGHLLKKLGLRNNASLARFALRSGLVPADVSPYERRRS